MFKISPSILETYRGVRGESKWEKTPEQLIDQLRGVSIYSPAMQFGTDVHEYLETQYSEKLHPEEIEQLKPLALELDGGAKEVKIRTNITSEIVLSTIIDNLHGNVGHEYKTGGRWYGVDNYYDSTQWKCYLLAFETEMVRYHHFEYKKTKKRPYLFIYRTFAFFPYVGMKEEIVQLCTDLIEWCHLNNVEHLIKYDGI